MNYITVIAMQKLGKITAQSGMFFDRKNLIINPLIKRHQAEQQEFLAYGDRRAGDNALNKLRHRIDA